MSEREGADQFERWARNEVVRLRREADWLEALLARFDGLAGRVPASRVAGTRTNGPLLRAVASAGQRGLSLQEVHDVARDAGMGSSRATVRSFLWNQVRAGRLAAVPGGRYALAAPGSEGAASVPCGEGGIPSPAPSPDAGPSDGAG